MTINLTDYISIKHWVDDDKPREKITQHGRSSLSNAELIAILHTNGTKNKSALDLAREILQLAENDLNKLIKASLTLDIQILDHIIVSNTGYYSFADEGKLI